MKRLTVSEWLDWRRAGIGGSDAPAVMGASKWTSRAELLAEKRGERTQRKFKPHQKAAMARGLALEPLAREEYQQMAGIAMPAICAEHATMPFIRASFDGISDSHRRVLEIKCPGREDHAFVKRYKTVPKKYLWQCVHLLLVSGYERLDYFSFDGLRGILVPFERDEKLERQLIDSEVQFWREVQAPGRATAAGILTKKFGNVFQFPSRRFR